MEYEFRLVQDCNNTVVNFNFENNKTYTLTLGTGIHPLPSLTPTIAIGLYCVVTNTQAFANGSALDGVVYYYNSTDTSFYVNTNLMSKNVALMYRT